MTVTIELPNDIEQALREERILVDEIKARRRAEDLGLRVTGTLSIFLLDGEQGSTDVPSALADLKRTSFRASAGLRESVLRRARQSRDSR